MNASFTRCAQAIWLRFLVRESLMLLRRAMAGLRRLVRMSVPVCIMDPKAGQPQWMMEASGMKDHNGVLMMQRVLLAGTLGMAMAQKAAAILEGEPSHGAPAPEGAGSPQGPEGAVLRAILDAANE